jgi:SAM-dependent methyltransferase
MTDILDESITFWDAHAERDPFWAVLSEVGKEERKWDVGRFFLTGVNEVKLIFYELESQGVDVQTACALDFGCGVGRLTQALAPRFERVVGVDVSRKMIETAAALNRFPDRASYTWNKAPHLGRFGDDTFDFIYTNLVLQHIVPEVTLAYLREFFRILKPAGVLVFQLPSHERRQGDPWPEPTATSMSDDAYQAALSVAGLPGGPVGPGAELELEVDVTNVSQLWWSRQESGAIQAGNHWLDQTGERTLQRDDGLAVLPETLAPGDTCRVPLTIRAPTAEGDYLCEFDLAHEGIRWFSDRNSSVVRFHVQVRVGGAEHTNISTIGASEFVTQGRNVRAAPIEWPSAAPGNPSVGDPGDFPMYGVQTDLVGRLIANCGGELLRKAADNSCGRGWISYRYFVRKAVVRTDGFPVPTCRTGNPNDD